MANEQPYTNEQGVLMVPRYSEGGKFIEYVPQDTAKQPGGLPPDQSYPGAEAGPGPDAGAPSAADPAANPATRARVQQWYQQYLGRGANDSEIDSWLRDHPDLQGIEEGLANSAEGKAYAAKGAAPAGGTGGAGAWTYGDDAQSAWMAWPGPGTVANIKSFADAWNKAHPSDLVSLGGSKGEKLTWRGKTYDTVISAGTGGTGKSWQDLSIAGGGGAGGGTPSGVDETYLGGYPGGGFEAPPGSEIPPAFEYEGFTPGEDTALPGEFSYEGFQSPGTFVTPDKAALENDPSYQFRKDQAMGALQNSASGRGLTNSGGTIYDLLGTSSQFASTEYGNVWDRQFKEWQDKYNTAKSTYDTNRGNAAENYALNLTGRQNAYDQALSKYTTGRSNALENWRTKYGVSQDVYNRARDEFDASVKDYYNNRDSAWEKLYKTAGLGANVTVAG
jgi:hypothetical protein